MLQLYFIRHGQSENNVVMEEVEREDYLFNRVVDPTLTEIGKQQAALTAMYLAKGSSSQDFDPQNRQGFGLTHLYCSLMSRAVQTATPIAAETGLTLVAMPDVHETGGVFRAEKQNGEIVLIGLPGKGRSYFTQEFPHLILPEDVTDDGWWNREKEPREQYPLRAQRVIDQLLENHGGKHDRVGIVMHGGIFARILSAFLDIRAHHYWFLMNNTAISRIDIRDDGHLSVIYMNKVDHLPAHLVT